MCSFFKFTPKVLSKYDETLTSHILRIKSDISLKFSGFTFHIGCMQIIELTAKFERSKRVNMVFTE